MKIKDDKGINKNWSVRHTVLNELSGLMSRHTDDKRLNNLSKLRNFQEDLKETKPEDLKPLAYTKKIGIKEHTMRYTYIMRGRWLVTFVQITNSEKYSLNMYTVTKTVDALADV